MSIGCNHNFFLVVFCKSKHNDVVYFFVFLPPVQSELSCLSKCKNVTFFLLYRFNLFLNHQPGFLSVSLSLLRRTFYFERMRTSLSVLRRIEVVPETQILKAARGHCLYSHSVCSWSLNQHNGSIHFCSVGVFQGQRFSQQSLQNLELFHQDGKETRKIVKHEENTHSNSYV